VTGHLRQSTRWALPALLLLVAACATYQPPFPVGTYQRAAAFRAAGKYREAVDAYAVFLQRNPTDSLADRAELEKAMAYMELKEYPLAAVELEILRQEYPTSPLLPEALYQEGRAYLLQVGRVERDITPAYDARQRFRSFLQLYPTSPLVPEVKQQLAAISDLIVRKKLGQAELYRRLNKPQAVAVVLDRLLETETETGLRDEVLWQRVRIALDLADTATARERLDELIREHPGSPHHDEAVGLGRRLAASPTS